MAHPPASASPTMGAASAVLIDRRMVAFRAPTLVAAMNTVGKSLKIMGSPSGAYAAHMLPDSDAVRFEGHGDVGPVSWKVSGSQLAALMIGYCIAARIPLPTKSSKTVTITSDAVVLDFITMFPNPPHAQVFGRLKPST